MPMTPAFIRRRLLFEHIRSEFIECKMALLCHYSSNYACTWIELTIVTNQNTKLSGCGLTDQSTSNRRYLNRKPIRIVLSFL